MKLEKSHYWKAVVEIEANNIAFSTVVNTHRKGMRVDHTELAKDQSWLDNDKVVFDIGKRLKGWVKEQARTMKPSLADKLRYSLAGNSMINDEIVFGPIIIGTIDELSGLTESEGDVECKKPDKFKLYPFRNVFVGENKNYVNSYHYTLPKKVRLKAELFCWTKDFNPTDCKQMFEVFGSGMGLGDQHSQGFGKFKLIEFKVIAEGDIL